MYYLMALGVCYTPGIMIDMILYDGAAAWETLVMLKRNQTGGLLSPILFNILSRCGT